jgi:Flp pilus assembly protein TadD
VYGFCPGTSPFQKVLATDAAFEDRPLVDIAHAARERSVSLVSFRADGTLSGWDRDLVAARPEECKAALGKGRACLQRGQFGRAARAFAAAQRATDAPTRASATASLALARARLGDDATAQTPPRAAPTRGTRRSR